MGRISDEDVARVRDATDLVTLIAERIVLKQKGRLYWGLCPFHGEKTPSFKVDPGTQLWHCFGCGRGGDAFGFVMESDKVDFPDAVRLLAERARIDIVEELGGSAVPRGRKDRLIAACEEAADYYHRVLTGSRDAKPSQAREYLAGRGFGSDVAKKWRLGFAPGRQAIVKHLTAAGFSADELVDANLALKSDTGQLKDRFYDRIMFPIADLEGRVIAFGGRVLGSGEPKYLNTNDTPIFRKSANMYAIDRAKALMTSSGTAVVVEGYTDVIALHGAGVTNAVATLGTALTRQHVKLLGRFAKRVVYLFDGDEAGMRAADRASEFIDADATPEAGGSRVELFVAMIPEGKDPADLVAAQGAVALNEVVESAVPLLQFSIDRRLARWDLDRPEERTRALKEAAEVLSPVKDSMLADDYANYIADKLSAIGTATDFATVKRAISQARPTVGRGGAEQAGAEATVGSEAIDTPRTKVERELLALLTGFVGIRGKARELLAGSLLSTPEHVAMAELLADAGEGLTAAEMSGLLEQRVPGSAKELAAARLVASGGEPDVLAEGLERRLKEFELERRIAVGRTQLKSPGSFKSSAEYDEVFREVSALQRALDALRRGAVVTETDVEA